MNCFNADIFVLPVIFPNEIKGIVHRFCALNTKQTVTATPITE